jgi:hypothetical protein
MCIMKYVQNFLELVYKKLESRRLVIRHPL